MLKTGRSHSPCTLIQFGIHMLMSKQNKVGTYEIEEGNLVFNIGKTLKQVLKDDKQNDAK